MNIEWKADKNPHANGEIGRAGKNKIALFNLFWNGAGSEINGIKGNWILTTNLPGFSITSFSHNDKDFLKNRARLMLETFKKNLEA